MPAIAGCPVRSDMELSTIFSKKTLLPRLRRFLQLQQLLVFIGVVFYALFAALKMPVSFVTMMLSIAPSAL